MKTLIHTFFTDWGRYEIPQEARDYYYRRGAIYGTVLAVGIYFCFLALSMV